MTLDTLSNLIKYKYKINEEKKSVLDVIGGTPSFVMLC